MTVATEYELLTQRAAIVDRSDRGKMLLTGGEAADFLQGQITNEVEGLEPGSGCYATLLTHKGKVLADMRVLRGDDWIWVDTEAVGLPGFSQNVRMYSLGRDVKTQDVTAERAILSLIGPAARDALDTAPPEVEHSFLEGRHGVYVATDVGVDVICNAADAAGVIAALGLEQVSEEAAECVRIESGRPRLGREFGSETIPQEAGLNERAVSFTKGCYVGQETVARLHYKGKPNRHLRGLRLSAPVGRGELVVAGEREVGKVGSACVSPVHGPIALAILRREAEPGQTVLVGDEGVEATVAELPFNRS